MKNNCFFYLFVYVLLSACTTDLEINGLHPDNKEEISSCLNVDDVTVSESQALFVADKFNNLVNTRGAYNKVSNVQIVSDDNKKPLMYIVNYVNKKFVIVSATKNYFPILAYSDESNFPISNNQGGIEGWLNETKYIIENSAMINDTTISKIRFIWKQYEELNENNINIETKGSSEENTLMARRITELRDQYPDYYFRPMSRCSASDFAYYGNDIYNGLCEMANRYNSPIEYTILGIKNTNKTKTVGPLLTTFWHQNAPYNVLCENKYPAGCVAIAMAQILKFHQYPTRYNWNNMPNISATYDTQRLIYEIGQAVEMDYGANGSSSNIDNAKKAFQGTFQYNARIADFNVDETKTELLNNKRPIYMRGSDNFLFFPKDGHAWVCDGVDDQYRETIYFVEFQQGYPGNYYYVSPYDGPTAGSPGEMFVGVLFFHMNWGWGDNNGNGWFGSNNVKVDGYDFSHNRKNLYISPNK